MKNKNKIFEHQHNSFYCVQKKQLFYLLIHQGGVGEHHQQHDGQILAQIDHPVDPRQQVYAWRRRRRQLSDNDLFRRSAIILLLIGAVKCLLRNSHNFLRRSLCPRIGHASATSFHWQSECCTMPLCFHGVPWRSCAKWITYVAFQILRRNAYFAKRLRVINIWRLTTAMASSYMH